MGDWKTQQPWVKHLPYLGGMWLLAAGGDRLWHILDRGVPAWDPADYLTGALNYWQAIQTAHWLSGEWWNSLWLLSAKLPPLLYLATVPFLDLFGAGPDQSTLVNLLYSAILLAAVYALGTILFSGTVGLWAAGFCLLMPALYTLRLDYLVDYPLTAMVTLCFVLLTGWRSLGNHRDGWNPPDCKPALDLDQRPAFQHQMVLQLQRLGTFLGAARLRPWWLAIALGLSLGLAFLTKQPALLCLLVPLLWVLGESLWQRAGMRVGQLLLAAIASIPVWYPWYRTNWLLMLTAGKRATIDSAIAEGDPSLLSLDAWIYYLKALPGLVSPPLLLVPLMGLLFFWRRSRVSSCTETGWDSAPKPRDYQEQQFASTQRSLRWLLIFLVGGYLLCSLNPNKDSRYITPLLPMLAVVLSYGFSLLPVTWKWLRWGTVGLLLALLLANIFPIWTGTPTAGQAFTFQHHAYLGPPFPHAQVIQSVVQADPYLHSTIGVLPSTAEVNQHNVNYYGLLHNFQVYGRQVGTRLSAVAKDGRSLSWFLTKTDDQGAIRQIQAQAALMRQVELGGDFQLQKVWQLPDRSALKLFRRRIPPLEVQPWQSEPAAEGATDVSDSPVCLEQVIVPAEAPPNQPIPVTYRWSGSWEALRSGLVILTWKQIGKPEKQPPGRWLHDHAIALGALIATPPERPVLPQYQVIERTAMLPPASIPAGTYTLEATYVNRQTGESQAIAPPAIRLKISPQATPTPAPELDLVTQLRILATTLPQGMSALERIIEEVGRISQYDPVQDYVTQTRQAMEYRLQQDPRNRLFAYTLALTNVLKRRIDPAIAALQTVIQLDPQNPNAHAYLAFVNLADFRAAAARDALQTALHLNPNLPELYALTGVADLMQGNPLRAWQNAQTYRQKVASQS